MSTQSDSLGDRLRTYFGLASTDDRVESKLADLKRRKTLRRLVFLVGLVVFAMAFKFALDTVGFSLLEINTYWDNFTSSLSEFFPIAFTIDLGLFELPIVDAGRYWEFLSGKSDPSIPEAAVETLAIAFAGTVLGAPLALLFGVLGSERVTPFPFNFIFRGTMSVIRAIPALVWALIYIPLGGLGPFTATLAIGTDTIGNLGRLFTDALEEVEDGPIEAIESTGASRPQTIIFGMLSQVFTSFIAWTLYVLEINVRIAVTMGLISAGGIGEILMLQRQTYSFYNLMATIFVVFVLVISVEMISQRTRSYLRGNTGEGFLSQLWDLVRGFPQRMADSVTR